LKMNEFLLISTLLMSASTCYLIYSKQYAYFCISIMERLSNVHPGIILKDEFLIPLKITASRLSKDLEIPQSCISQIINGKRRITANTALRLSSYFGISAKFWLGLQNDFDIEEEKSTQSVVFEKIRSIRNKTISQQII